SSQGNWISASIVTEGWPVSDIVVSSLSLDGVAPAEGASGTVNGNALTAKFPRAPFAARPDGDYELLLTGQRSDGTRFEGTASLSVHGSSGGARNARIHGLRVVRAATTSVAIAFSLAQPSETTVDILDLQGRLVARLEHGALPGGEVQSEWRPAGQVPAGVYLVRVRAEGSEAATRLAFYR